MALNKTSKELQIFVGSTLANRYTVESFLGQGACGFVSKCHDKETNKKVAIKVNKGQSDVFQMVRGEINTLKQLRSLDPDTCNIVRWNGFFFNNEQLCMNFELLDQSLSAYIKDRDRRGLPVTEVRPIVHQLATALSHLKSLGIVHADLKPDNVMVVNRHETPVKVKIIDFGLALPVASIQPGMRPGTVWYMAPEVTIQAPFNEANDMWALGQIAVELAIGYPLYPGSTGYDVLMYIMNVQGQLPDRIIEQGLGAGRFFWKGNTSQQRFLLKTPEQFAQETGFLSPDRRWIQINHLDDLEVLMEMRLGYQSDQHLLVSLIKQMLDLDPDLRIKPQEVLQHPFFCPTLPQSSLRPIEMSNNDHSDLSSPAPSLPEYRRQDLQPPNPSLAVILEVDDEEANAEPENHTENKTENKPENHTENHTENKPENHTENKPENHTENHTENVYWLRRFINRVTDTFTRLWYRT